MKRLILIFLALASATAQPLAQTQSVSPGQSVPKNVAPIRTIRAALSKEAGIPALPR